MKSLKLYPATPTTPLDTATPKQRNLGCADCKLGPLLPAGQRCTMPAKVQGAALVLGTYPGRLTSSNSVGTFIAGVVARVQGEHPEVAVLHDSAVRCASMPRLVPDDLPGPPPEGAVNACRGYLATVVRTLKPTRILVLGDAAARAVLGEDHPPLTSARRAYAYTKDGIPVFMLRDPEPLVENRFLRAEWANDLRWALTATPRNAPLHGLAKVVETVADAEEAVRALYGAPWVAWDTETFGRMYDRAFRIISVAVCAAGSDDAFVWDADALARPDVLAPLLELLADPDIEKTAMNAKYDGGAARCAWNLEVQGSGRDVGLERALLEPEALKRLEVQQYLVGMGGGKREMNAALANACTVVKRLATAALDGQATLFSSDKLPPGVNLEHALLNPMAYAFAYTDRTLCSRYNALDAVSTARLEQRHQWMLDRPGNECLRYIWDELVRHISPAVEQMEAWGVRVNPEAIAALGAYLTMEKGRVRRRLELAGLHDPGSPDKIAELLFVKLKLPAEYETAGGKPSTADEALEAIKHLHPVVGDIQEYRTLDKLDGTYCEGLRKQITDDGLIHVDYDPSGARTGRMSAGGGMHGLPRAETDEGRMVRNVFVALPEEDLLEVDVSQAELRALAGLSGDPVMVTILNTVGADYHQRTAERNSQRIWHIGPEQVEPKHRSQAKIINLALIYGRGDAALAAEVTAKSKQPCTKEEAAAIRTAITGDIHVANAWMEEQKTFAERWGYARTFFRGKPARRRPLPAIGMSGDDQHVRKIRSGAKRAAANTPVQGSNNDVIMEGIILTVRAFKRAKLRARIGLNTHDSLLMAVHKDDRDAALSLVRSVFSKLSYGPVMVVLDAKAGRAYGSLKKLPEKTADADGAASEK